MLEVSPLLLVALLIAQATSPSPMGGVAFDLAKLKPLPCAMEGSDIVVCARDRSRDRVIDVAPLPEPQMPKAEFDLGEGLSIESSVEGASVGGFPSNRLMMRLKKKF